MSPDSHQIQNQAFVQTTDECNRYCFTFTGRHCLVYINQLNYLFDCSIPSHHVDADLCVGSSLDGLSFILVLSLKSCHWWLPLYLISLASSWTCHKVWQTINPIQFRYTILNVLRREYWSAETYIASDSRDMHLQVFHFWCSCRELDSL